MPLCLFAQIPDRNWHNHCGILCSQKGCMNMNTVSHTLKGFAEKTTVKQNFFTKILINGQMLI